MTLEEDDTLQYIAGMSVRGAKIPEHMHYALMRYIVHGEIPGDFLQAVICNNLREACAHADDTNLLVLYVYVSYLYNYAPAPCWGSREKMLDWSKLKREERDVTVNSNL